MQPVIPLQPYIAQGEGSGSAFILPRQQRQSAIDVLAQDFRVKKAEEQARNKQFQDELVALEGLGKGLLPNDEKRIRDEYQKHLDWIGQQGLTGTMNPANPSSPNYLENKKKMNQLSSLANIGKYRKELLTDLQRKALTGEYDEESLARQREYITNTPIEEFDVNKVGQIEKRFNPNDYLQNALQGVKLEEETKIENVRPLLNEKGQRVLGQNIGDEVTAPKAGEIDRLVTNLTSDNSYDGRRYKNYLTEQYFSLPEEQQKAIQQKVIRTNASAKDNKDLLLQGIVQELAKGDLSQRFQVKRTNKIIGEDQPSKGLNVNLGGGKITPNKWGLFPSETVHERQSDKYKTRNMEQLRALNIERRKQGMGELEYDEAYPKQNVKYDEVVFENQDVSENKTFQYPDGKGGLIDVTPISVRREKESNEWKLVGKKKVKQGNNTVYVDVELTYSAAVRQKTDAILGINTNDYLIETFGRSKPKSTPPPKKDAPSGGAPRPKK